MVELLDFRVVLLNCLQSHRIHSINSSSHERSNGKDNGKCNGHGDSIGDI